MRVEWGVPDRSTDRARNADGGWDIYNDAIPPGGLPWPARSIGPSPLMTLGVLLWLTDARREGRLLLLLLYGNGKAPASDAGAGAEKETFAAPGACAAGVVAARMAVTSTRLVGQESPWDFISGSEGETRTTWAPSVPILLLRLLEREPKPRTILAWGSDSTVLGRIA